MSPDVIPESFSLNKCQDFPSLPDSKQLGLTSRYLTGLTPDSEDSSGFSEKCSDYLGGGEREVGRERESCYSENIFLEVQPSLPTQPPLTPHNERNIREQSGKVFPSELEMMARLAEAGAPPSQDCPLYSTMPR